MSSALPAPTRFGTVPFNQMKVFCRANKFPGCLCLPSGRLAQVLHAGCEGLTWLLLLLAECRMVTLMQFCLLHWPQVQSRGGLVH